ncbi:MAG: IPExxxVDY family protein [Bacteroidales bacterium]
MVRKLRLTSVVSYDYTIFGVSCHLKDYRFAFFLNDKLGFGFKRKEDLIFREGADDKAYSFYIYPHPDERRNYYLVSNYNEAGRLIPSEKGVDFFIIADDLLPAQLKKSLLSKVQSVSQVLAAYEIPKGKVKNLEVIFEEIEMHLL